MAKPINLTNERSWKTQTAALAHFKAMLARYSDNQAVEDRSDHDDLVALLERYDAAITNSPAKIGCGIDHFFRRRNVGEGYSTPGFWIHRTDGTDTDFSYIDAVKGQPKSNAQEFYDACRGAVAADLLGAKKRHFDTHADSAGRVPCDLSDELISFAEAHLDHAYPTFGQLVVSFRAARGWQHGVPVGILTPPADAQTTTSFLDGSVADAISAISSRCRDITRCLSDTQFGDVCRATKTEDKAASATLTAGLTGATALPVRRTQKRMSLAGQEAGGVDARLWSQKTSQCSQVIRDDGVSCRSVSRAG